MDLLNKKVLIVGFGKSGQAVLRYCIQHGARPAVTDVRGEEAFSSSLVAFSGYPVDWFFGKPNPDIFTSADLIVVSPGVPPTLPELVAARKAGVPIVGEIELALGGMEQKPKIIAVTGTNGKTTTVSLIHHLLQSAGKKSVLAGNVGTPLIDCLEELKTAEFLVLEISSYQIETSPSLKPDVAIWLNVTEDHLDWHEDFSAYVSAKAKLIRQTAPNGLVIYNVEDSVVALSVEQIPSSRLPFSVKRQLKMGGWVEEGGLCLKTGLNSKAIRFELARATLKGIHNWENMLSALLALSPYIKEEAILQKGLENFVPLPHRMQVVREIAGVKFINDSKGTNVGATLKALATTPFPIVWIAGGKDKGGSYEPLKELVKKRVKKAFLLGEAKEKMAESLKGCTEIVMTKDLQEAVVLSLKTAKAGESVLFSPACSSFDMFKDYADRGNRFMELVKSL
ncbi:MAG: UDP-N-acetylmuramoyl-L-alanine--D-glutamate ligase [Deltaproteobacteria bacterium]|nr:UDP-N-acetylmuramoyl-L-alanine--D-glutamate ligase [Deltaproteobacteria bacterium]